MKEKELNFKNLANSRVNKAIKLLRLISNYRTKVYAYSQEEADKIVPHLITSKYKRKI